MGVYAPTVIADSTGPLTIQMVGALTYNEFLNSLGILFFSVNAIFIEANSTSQVRKKITYNIVESGGNAYQVTLTPAIDPNQNQPALLLENKIGPIILNGMSELTFDILPNETVYLTMCMDRRSVNDFMNYLSKSNFQRGADPLGNLELFNDNPQQCR